jgi:sensor histidine kinase YesM
MEIKKGFKYAIVLAGWLLLLVILNSITTSFIDASGVAKNNTIPGHSHLQLGVTALIFKTLFIALMFFHILPSFTLNKNLTQLITKSALLLTICFIGEQYLQAYITRSSWPEFSLDRHGFLRNNPFWSINLLLYFFFLLGIGAYYFIQEWIKNEKSKRALMEIQLTTELNFLKNQINPHFLFNTLNNLFSMAQQNNDTETANGISKLAGLMRYIIYDSSVTKISLDKEIKNINDFIALSKLRYQHDEVELFVDIGGETASALIAPMLLLPFIENAFKHGVKIEKKTKIFTSIFANKDKITFTCSNPVIQHKKAKDELHGGIGLENVKRRLALLYPSKHRLEIADNGVTFTINLELDL